MKKILSLLLALALVLSFSLVAVPVGANGGVPDRVTAITLTADRLVALQGTDGGWDWIVTGLTEHSVTYPSPANLFGVTALGLIDAYQVTGNETYKTAAELTADHLKGLSRATDPAVRFMTFDYRFLVEFSELSGNTSYEAHALSEWNWVKTNVAAYYADGNQETIYNFWATSGGATHGFAAWQAGDAGLAALAMGDTSWASNMAAVLAGHLAEITGSDIYRFIGWGHALEFLNAVDSTTYATEIATLVTTLTGDQNGDGSWVGTSAQGTVQNTAYVVMGLASVGEGNAARAGADWLVANQITSGNSIGGWIETDTKEYSEVDSEALQALAATAAPVTIGTDGFYSIQAAVDAAQPGDTINVSAGEYAGAIVNKDVNIIGAAGGASIITTGVPYKPGSPLNTGFRLDADADGTEIRNFTMNGDYASYFWFAVFARSADDVTVDSLTVNAMVQGITNWGGSGWEITNNVLDNTYPIIEGPVTGGGISIYLGGDPSDFPHCDNNLVQGNIISTSAEQSGSFTGSAITLWFDMRNLELTALDGTESVTGNEIKDNSITATGLENQVGISTGVGGLDGDENPDKVAGCLGISHDNTVENNTIDNAEWGLYLYVTTDLTVQGNKIKNCSDCGIYMKDDNAGCHINYNDIYDNSCGLNNTDGATYARTVDALYNWWGDVTGPSHDLNLGGQGDTVSDNVDFSPWLHKTQEQFVSGAPCYAGSVVLENEATDVGSGSYAGGWNSFSTPVTLDSSANSVSELLALTAGSGLFIERAQRFDAAKGWVAVIMGNVVVGGEDYQIKPGEGLFIQVSSKGSLPILCNNDATPPPMTYLVAGWNLIGMSSLKAETVETALSGVSYSVVLSPKPPNGVAWSVPPAGAGTEELLLGEAYWVAMGEPGILFGFTTTPVADDMTWELNQ